jgi:hypothetical protein
MLLPSDDPAVLAELSVGFEYDRAENTKDANGVVVIHDATLKEVSVVYRGAQGTTVSDVKARPTTTASTWSVTLTMPTLPELDEINARLDALLAPRKRWGDEDPIDAFIREDRALREAEEAERQRKADWEQGMYRRARQLDAFKEAELRRVPLTTFSWVEETAREAEFREHEAAQRAERDARKAAEREAEQEADAAYRERVRNDPRTLTP